MTSNQAGTVAAAVISAGNRESILKYASELLPLRGRQAPAVLTAAAPLLGWAGRAAGKDDLQARMAALSRAYNNGCLRPQTVEEFLGEADAYYEFLIARS